MGDSRFCWHYGQIARLRDLWDEGLSTAEIGRRLGKSKSAIVGKAHRLDLPSRPSPIRRGGVRIPETIQRMEREARRRARLQQTLNSLASLAEIQPEPEPAPHKRTTTCCWPLGLPGGRSFRFCGETSEPGKPYCSDHCRLSYVKVRPMREEV